MWCAITAVMAPAPSFGQTSDREPIRIEYEAPPACPTAEAFASAVTARTSKMRFAAPNEEARTFSIVIDPTGASLEGRLVMRDAEGSEVVRAVASRSCDDIADALAIIVGLAVDPTASITRRAVSISASRAAAEPTSTPATTTPPPDRSLADTSNHAEPRARWSFWAAADGRETSAVAPSPSVGPELAIETRRESSTGMTPALRLGFLAAAAPSEVTSAGIAQFRWLAAVATACPLEVLSSELATVRPCAQSDVGQAYVSGSNAPLARTVHAMWWDAGGSLRLTSRLGPRVDTELEAGAIFPIVRNQFHFEPATPVHAVPPVGFTASVGLAMKIL
jgi:hypothetical protein